MKTKLAALFILVFIASPAAAWASETYVPPPDSVKPPRVTVQSIYAAKCSKCHPISRPDGAAKTSNEWETTVSRMRSKDPAWMSQEDAGKIISFLSGRSLFNVKCIKCHSATRADVQKTVVQWQNTVDRMQAKRAEWISDDDKKLILFYLTDVELLDIE